MGLLAFSYVNGLGPTRLRKLASLGDDLWELWKKGKPHDLGSIINMPPESQAHWMALRNSSFSAEGAYEALLKKGYTFLCWDQKNYPPALRCMKNPPAVLYANGSLNSLLNQEPGLGVVGSRLASDYGKEMTRQLLYGLGNTNIPIISGLAEGIDTEAHKAALHAGLPTIAVFGCGLDTVYPFRNRSLAQDILDNGGVLLSEYAPEEPPNARNFPKRNRIIAGLSKAVLVVEASRRSGALITAHYALEENRTVMAVPNNPDLSSAQGPLELIRQGAVAVWKREHLLAELLPNWHLEALETDKLAIQKKKENLSSTPYCKDNSCSSANKAEQAKTLGNMLAPADERQNKLYQLLDPSQPMPIDKLQSHWNGSITELMSTLTMLELDGWVSILPGQQIKRLLPARNSFSF